MNENNGRPQLDIINDEKDAPTTENIHNPNIVSNLLVTLKVEQKNQIHPPHESVNQTKIVQPIICIIILVYNAQ